MFSKLLQISVFAIMMISMSLCSRQTCIKGYENGSRLTTNRICDASGSIHSCEPSSCSAPNDGKMTGCTADSGQGAPTLSSSQVLKCEEFYSTTGDGQIHCRAQKPYPYIVKCKTWKPVVCSNCS